MHTFKNNILRTLRRYNTRPRQDVSKIPLGCAVILALGRPLGHKLGVHLHPPRLDSCEGHPRSLDADRSLDSVGVERHLWDHKNPYYGCRGTGWREEQD